MQCNNCGYIFFQPTKKCACCSAPYAPAQTAFDIGQEHLFTIFEMAPGEGGMAASGSMALADTGVGGDDFNFTDDFDMGDVEYGVDENVLDLSDAEAEGFGPSTSVPVPVPASSVDFDYNADDMGGMASFPEEIGPDDFELDLSESTAAPIGSMGLEAEPAMPDVSLDSEAEVSLDLSAEGDAEPEIEATLDSDFGGSGFDSEVEGLGFGFDETSGEEAPEVEAATEEISLDLDVEPEAEAEISLEPELELSDDEPEDEEPSLVLSDDEDDEDEGVSLELSEEPELDMGDLDDTGGMDGEEIELSDDTDFETFVEDSTDYEDVEEDAGGIDFDLDSVDLDAPEEEASLDEEPEVVDLGGDTAMELDGLELEMEAPEEPEEEEKL